MDHNYLNYQKLWILYFRLVAILLAISGCSQECRAHPLDFDVINLTIHGLDGEGTLSLGASEQMKSATLNEKVEDPSKVLEKVGELSFKGAQAPCSLNLRDRDPSLQNGEYLFNTKCTEGEYPRVFTIRRSLKDSEGAASSAPSMYILSIDGRTYSVNFSAQETFREIIMEPSLGVYDFLRLGLEHIGVTPEQWSQNGSLRLPDGIDHILFVLTLVLASSSFTSLLGTVTGFTVGHSLTLTCVALFKSGVPPSLVEPAIAGSIAFMAFSVIRGREAAGAWVTTLLFGMIHGLGFAASMLEHKLSGKHLVLTLLAFNLGIELGQLFIVLIFAIILWSAIQFMKKREIVVVPLSALIFLIAIYWTAERICFS